MKYISIVICLLLLPFINQAQDGHRSCGFDSQNAVSFGQKLLPQLSEGVKKLQKSLECSGSVVQYPRGEIKKIIPIKFHIVDDGNNHNFPDNPGTRKLFNKIIEWANNQFINNEPINPYFGSTQPPAAEVDFKFVIKSYEFYTATSLPDNGVTYNNDDNALNVYCHEKRESWIPQPPEILPLFGQDTYCQNPNGSFIIRELTPGKSYSWRYRKNGGSLTAFLGPAVADANGHIEVTGLEAGSYSDVHVREEEYNQISNSTFALVKSNATSNFYTQIVSFPTCGSNNGEIKIGMGGTPTPSGHFVLKFNKDGVPFVRNANFVNGEFSLIGLGAGYYSDFRVEASNGCVMGADLFVNLVHDPTTIAAPIAIRHWSSSNDKGRVKFGLPTNVFANTLDPNQTYKIWIRTDGTGPYIGSLISANDDDEFVMEDLDWGYYEVYFTDVNDCNRLNHNSFRIGIDKRPSSVGGYTNYGSERIVLLEMYHHFLYRISPGNVNNPGEPYEYLWSFYGYVNYYADNITHEFGHVLQLGHVFDPVTNHCYDTPLTGGCETNNYMSSICGIPNRAFSQCQMDVMQDYLESGDWGDRWYYATGEPGNTSDISYSFDNSTGLLYAFNDFTGPPSGINEVFIITPQNGETFYSFTPILQLSMQAFAGQTVEICANTVNADKCMGTEDCVTVTFPSLDDCKLDQVSYIDVILDANGIPTALDPSSSPNKPHYWTYTFQNGSSLSATCEHSPDIIYSDAATFAGDVLEVCVSVMGQVQGQICTTEICTTIVIPPSEPLCGSPVASDFLHFIDRKSTPNTASDYFVTLRSQSPFNPTFQDRWYVIDNISGIESNLTGAEVELYDGIHFIRDGKDIDLRVCHVVWDKYNACIVASSCEDIRYSCSVGLTNHVIRNLAFDPVSQNLTFNLAMSSSLFATMSYEVLFNGQSINPSVVVAGNSVMFTFPAPHHCGTAHIEIIASYLLSPTVQLCGYDDDVLVYGPQPCIHNVTGGSGSGKGTFAQAVGTRGKRTGLASSGYDITIAPNPTQADFTMLYIETPEAEQLTVSIFDMQGRTVKRQQHNAEKGANALRLELQDLATGLYMIRVQGKQQQQTKKLLIE